jgi:hypothetical protein
MTPPFKPPAREELPTLDTADGVEYETEVRTVEGAMAPGGSGDVRSGYDVHLFSLAAWRTAGNTLLIRELVLFRAVPPVFSQGNGSAVFDEFPDYSLQRFSVIRGGRRCSSPARPGRWGRSK